MQLAADCPPDTLAENWQRLILTHLAERTHPGVLIGAPLTDVKITLAAGRAHQKHTEGGDFRQATYRAVRQGLRMAEAKDGVRLLEPWYDFTLELPADALGRAMADVQRMCGSFEAPETSGGTVRLTGRLPVATARAMRGRSRPTPTGWAAGLCCLPGTTPAITPTRSYPPRGMTPTRMWKTRRIRCSALTGPGIWSNGTRCPPGHICPPGWNGG